MGRGVASDWWCSHNVANDATLWVGPILAHGREEVLEGLGLGVHLLEVVLGSSQFGHLMQLTSECIDGPVQMDGGVVQVVDLGLDGFYKTIESFRSHQDDIFLGRS